MLRNFARKHAPLVIETVVVLLTVKGFEKITAKKN